MSAPSVSAIVPTLGRSPCLEACLGSLRRTGERLRDAELEIVVVDQTDAGLESSLSGIADRVLRPRDRPLSFAAANNLAIRETRGAMIALVNDDAVVDDAWLETLLPWLDDEQVGAVQGTNLMLDDSGKIDGRGLAWNRWLQAIQIDRGEAPEHREPMEVFGVSATAAVYRRSALEAVCHDGFGSPFDLRLESYYEDVDLAIRLRSAGWRAWTTPIAVARHVGSATGASLPFAARKWIHGNRILVLARMFGWSFAVRAPRILVREGMDLWQARRRGDHDARRGIVQGLIRALRLLPRFLRPGPPFVDRHWWAA